MLLIFPMFVPRWAAFVALAATLLVALPVLLCDPIKPGRRERNMRVTVGLTAEQIESREKAMLEAPARRWDCPKCKALNPKPRFQWQRCSYSLV